MHLSSEQTGSAEQHVSQSTEKTEAGKPTQNQQDSNDVKENVSSGMRDKSLENANLESEPVEAHSDSKTKLKTSDGQSGKTIFKKKSGTDETLRATNPAQSDNSNVSAEEKTMQDLIKTVIRVSSTSKTVNVVEDLGVEIKGDEETVSNKPSSVDSESAAQEEKSEVKKSEVRKGNAGRRGESGLKMLKSGAAASKEDASRSLFADEAKLAKQKGESILMNKNGPSSQFPSKNTREMPTADLLFEHQQPRRSLPTGPKHTPPLKDKESLLQVRNCENRGTKKRKGEAFTMECFTQDPSKQVESATDSDTALEKPLSTTEFSKAATNEPSTRRSDIPALDSDGEAVLMKQTSTNEISATASSDSTASERTSEAKVLEISENKTAFAEDVVKSKTTEGEDLDKASANSNKHSEVKSEEGESANRKASDGETKNGKQNDQATANSRENSEVKIPETSKKKTTEDAKRKTSDKEIQNGQQHEKTTAKTNSERKTSAGAENVAKQKKQVKNAEFLHSVGAGSSVFETSFMNVHTDGSLQDLSEEECRHIEGVQALVVRNKQFSAWLSLDTKNIE